jgi:hypothetical protein
MVKLPMNGNEAFVNGTRTLIAIFFWEIYQSGDVQSCVQLKIYFSAILQQQNVLKINFSNTEIKTTGWK